MNQLDFSIIEKAGVSQSLFGRLCGVSRVTVNTWVSGGRHPNRTRLTLVKSMLDSLTVAVDRGLLPIPVRDPHVQIKHILDSITPTTRG